MKRPLELSIGPILIGLVSAMLGSLALFAIAIGLALTYIGLYITVEKAAQRLVVARRIGHHEVVEGTPLTLEFEVGGLSGLPAGVEMLCRCGEWHPLALGMNTVRWTLDRPGRHAIEPSPLRIKDDLGVFTKTMLVGHPDEILVLPAPAPIAPYARRGAMDAAHDPEPDGIRPYVRGTPMSRIHWKSAARGGELMERAFSPARDHLPLVVVDTTNAPSGAAVDWAARTAAGHVLALARGGGCRLLLPGDRSAITLMDPVAHWPAVHRRLASLGKGSPAAGISARDRADAVSVHASMAPPEAVVPRRALPPGVVAVGEWAGE